MVKFELLNSRITEAYLGYIPMWLSEANPKSAQEQLDDGYTWGGFQPFEGFILGADDSLSYPGDPDTKPWARAVIRNEIVVIYPHGWVAVIQPDRSFVVARMD